MKYRLTQSLGLFLLAALPFIALAHGISEEDKQRVYKLPNFSPKVFEEISGIKTSPKKAKK